MLFTKLSSLLVIASLMGIKKIKGMTINNVARQNGLGSGMCNGYTIINVRGTGETAYQESKPFVDVNNVIRNRLQGGQTYIVNYPAAITQDSRLGSIDIINKVTSTLATNPNMCFFLEGYSQGAAAIMNALPNLAPYYDSIRGIAVVGNPKSSTGLQSLLNLDILFRNPKSRIFKCKTLDICALGDVICGLPTGGTGGIGHLSYTFDTSTHDRVIDFAREALTRGISACYQSSNLAFVRRDDFASEMHDDFQQDVQSVEVYAPIECDRDFDNDDDDSLDTGTESEQESTEDIDDNSISDSITTHRRKASVE